MKPHLKTWYSCEVGISEYNILNNAASGLPLTQFHRSQQKLLKTSVEDTHKLRPNSLYFLKQVKWGPDHVTDKRKPKGRTIFLHTPNQFLITGHCSTKCTVFTSEGYL